MPVTRSRWCERVRHDPPLRRRSVRHGRRAHAQRATARRGVEGALRRPAAQARRRGVPPLRRAGRLPRLRRRQAVPQGRAKLPARAASRWTTRPPRGPSASLARPVSAARCSASCCSAGSRRCPSSRLACRRHCRERRTCRSTTCWAARPSTSCCSPSPMPRTGAGPSHRREPRRKSCCGVRSASCDAPDQEGQRVVLRHEGEHRGGCQVGACAQVIAPRPTATT